MKLIENVLQCPRCQDSIYGLKKCMEHSCVILYNVKPEYEFDWIVLFPGLLHYEMNTGKSFMNLNWSIFMKEVCKELGLKSDNALNYIKKGFDHHKLWEVLEICYIALSDELLLPYVRHCLSENIECLEGYWEYANDAINDTYIYDQQMAFIFLHSLVI